MKLRRRLRKETHVRTGLFIWGKKTTQVHRIIMPQSGSLAGMMWATNDDWFVYLAQIQPRGLWRFSEGSDQKRDHILFARHGEMPLRVALTKLRMGLV